MAEVAGLVLGAVGVAGVFSACIECFDIVIAAKDFSEDYEQLCALRLRFCLWGELVGLIPSPSADLRLRLRYDQYLDRPDVKPSIERILNNVQSLLKDASRVDEKYRPEGATPQEPTSNSRGLDVFKSPFERFKFRVRKHQKDAPSWQLARWAVHDAKKFEDIINRLEKFIDGLEAITKSLGSLLELQNKLQKEVEAIPDLSSLELLHDASSKHRFSIHHASNSSSRRLVRDAAESVLERKSLASMHSEFGTTFITARTKLSTVDVSLRSYSIILAEAWPEPSASRSTYSNTQSLNERKYLGSRALNSQLEANEKGEKQDQNIDLPNIGSQEGSPNHQTETASDLEVSDVPHNQRFVRDLLEKSGPRKSLSFTAGDASYGKSLTTVKKEDEKSWLGNSSGLVMHAESGSSAAKRMFLELRNIRTSNVRFISAAPVGDSLEKVLASIEGPPETPYEGDIFWITVKLSRDPDKPPLMRFQTKIYHPNISPQGHICADYKQRWNPTKSDTSTSSWYRKKEGDINWSLGALLIAFCGLLASPDVADPLVPEIAQKYLEDYEGYWQAAKLYTKRYAQIQRPEESALVFLEDLINDSTEAATYMPPKLKRKRKDTVSKRPPLESEYNERYPEKQDPAPLKQQRPALKSVYQEL